MASALGCLTLPHLPDKGVCGAFCGLMQVNTAHLARSTGGHKSPRQGAMRFWRPSAVESAFALLLAKVTKRKCFARLTFLTAYAVSASQSFSLNDGTSCLIEQNPAARAAKEKE